MSKLWKPSRRLFLAGSAGLITAPAIVQAGSMTLLGTGKPDAAGVAFAQGIYFRATNNQSSPTNYDVETATTLNYPRVSAQGNNVGWTVASAGISVADRDVTTDVRLKGIAFSVQANVGIYRIDLPSAGTYKVRFGAGDSGFGHNCRIRVFDNASLLLDYDGGNVASNNWIAANSTTQTTEANWAAVGLVSLTFVSTICNFEIGASTGGNADTNWVVNTVFVSS